MSSPVKAVAPFTFEIKRPRYLAIVDRSPAELVSDVAVPQLVEMLENEPAEPVAESFRDNTAECVNVVLTHDCMVALVWLMSVKTGTRL